MLKRTFISHGSQLTNRYILRIIESIDQRSHNKGIHPGVSEVLQRIRIICQKTSIGVPDVHESNPDLPILASTSLLTLSAGYPMLVTGTRIVEMMAVQVRRGQWQKYLPVNCHVHRKRRWNDVQRRLGTIAKPRFSFRLLNFGKEYIFFIVLRLVYPAPGAIGTRSNHVGLSLLRPVAAEQNRRC